MEVISTKEYKKLKINGNKQLINKTSAMNNELNNYQVNVKTKAT